VLLGPDYIVIIASSFSSATGFAVGCSALFCSLDTTRVVKVNADLFRILPQDVGNICVQTPADVEDGRTASTFRVVHDTVGKLGTRICVRHCPTSRNAAGSIPDGVIGIFH
jgi:hypothetical protein